MKEELVKLFKYLLLFGVVIFLLDHVITMGLDHVYFENAQKGPKTVYSIEKAKADIVIFGSSRASHHYVPKVFEDSLGLNCYNAGLDGRNIFYHTAVFKTMLKRFHPRIIVFDITSMDFEEKDKSEDFKGLSILNPFYSKYKSEISEILYLQGPYEKYKLMSGLYRYNSKLDDVLLTFVKPDSNSPDLKGYDPLYGEWKGKVINRVLDLQNKQKDEIKIRYMKNFVNLAHEHRCKVFLFVSPDFYRYDREMDYSFVSDELSADGFWSYQNDTTFVSNNKYFKDGTHLNHDGAVKYSEIVSSLIKAEIN